MAGDTLFVIIDPSQDQQPALTRAASLARTGGGRIHAFCCVYESDFSPYSSRREGKRLIREQAQAKLEVLLKPLRDEGIEVNIEVFWNQDWLESAVSAAARAGADLLLKSSFSHGPGSKLLSSRSDHYVLRHSPCPVLLSKITSDLPYRRVLAALALEDNDRKHDLLNNHVIAQAQRICRRTGAALHVVSALEGAPNIGQILKIIEDEDEEKLSSEQMISEHFGVDKDKVFIDYGPAKAVITEAAEKLAADLLVIGTVARSGLSGALVGNTCEKVLDALTVDVLTVS